jgi:hypothetical protein
MQMRDCVSTNHGTVPYANEGLILQQLQVFCGTKVQFKLLAGVDPWGAGVLLLVLACGLFVCLAGSFLLKSAGVVEKGLAAVN